MTPSLPKSFVYLLLDEEVSDLLAEARDNCMASIAEDGITEERKKYRLGLYARLDSFCRKYNIRMSTGKAFKEFDNG